MKEYERAIEKGLLPRNFLMEEVRCDFLITKQRKKLWAVIIDLIDVFDKVCKKYGFTYYIHAGSLLGAIRHNGFIPWDDDFDVSMPRRDYNKFIELKNEFAEPYFLQTPYTDPESAYSYAKIRNSNTTGLSKMFRYSDFNHGIWITVFPLDNWDLDGGEERYARIQKLNIYNSTYMRINNPKLDPKNVKRVTEYLKEGRNHILDYDEIQRLASFCRDPNSEYSTTAVITQESYNYKLWKTKDFGEPVLVGFEGLVLPAPCASDRLLTRWYGDYMRLPPKQERGKWHSDTIFDPDKPYKEYLGNERIHFTRNDSLK